MSTIGGNNSIQDGLVFSYDTGNRLKSFRGEPTVNIITNTDLDVGWSKHYCTGIQWNDIPPPQGINSPVVSFYDADTNKSGYWYSYGDYAPQVPNTTYTVSLWVKTNDSNFSVKAYTADNTEVGRVGTVYKNVPNDGLWHRVVWDSFLNISTSESDSLSFQFTFGNPKGESQRTWICAPQMEANDHATPFTPNTRTATDSLLDLTKNTTIDVTNTSFDSEGQMFFDGVDDYVDLGSDIIFKETGGWSIENITKFNTVPQGYNGVTSPGNFIGAAVNTYNSWYWSVMSGKLALWNISPGVWKYGSTIIQPNQYYHTVLVCSPDGTSYQMYLNGEPEGGDHVAYSWNPVHSGLSVRYIGAGTPTQRVIDGSRPIAKIYDKDLTPQQVKQNFNSIKSRFGIM